MFHLRVLPRAVKLSLPPLYRQLSTAEKIVSKLPTKFQPYAKLSRMEKPMGTWLLYAPCVWSLSQASMMSQAPLSTSSYYLGVYLLGSWLTRGAGCTINDIWDQDLDAHVERTTSRPLAAKQVTTKQAVKWLGIQSAASIGVLASLPPSCWAVGAASIVPVLVYPLFKRFTYYPQIWLSLWFSWGAVMGFPALGLSLSEPKVIGASLGLLTAGFAWSMIYDTIYGHQDKLDDIKVGVKSTALKWGDRTKPIAYRFWALQTAGLVASGVCSGMTLPFYLGTAWGMTRFLQMIRKVDLNNSAECGQFFKRNIANGYIIGGGALISYLLTLI